MRLKIVKCNFSCTIKTRIKKGFYLYERLKLKTNMKGVFNDPLGQPTVPADSEDLF